MSEIPPAPPSAPTTLGGASGGASAPKVVVFDLDDTLYDCLGQCVGPAQEEAARAMVEAGAKATVEEVLEARLALSGMPGTDVDDAVAASFRSVSPTKVAEAGRRAFVERDPGPVVPFPFAREVLRRARERARVVLLTTGHVETQRKKVLALGLSDAFDEAVYDDVNGRGGKEEALRRWLLASGADPADVLVVGDRADSEVAAALRLGMRALRVRGGEFASRPTPPGAAEADDVRGVLVALGIAEGEGPDARPLAPTSDG